VTVPFTVFQLIGVLDAGQYTVGITINQDVATSSTTLTDGALNMTISPPTGRYVTGQTFDLAIIISGPKATVESGSFRFGPQSAATWDWVDISSELSTCLIEGRLTDADSTIFLCRNVPTALAGPGRFGVLASVVLSDGTALTDLLTWEIRAAEGF
jgi:hypothetical protein